MADATPRPDVAPAEARAGDEDLIAGLVSLGIDRAIAADYVRRGDPEGAVFESVLLPARAKRTVSAEQIAAEGGLGVDDISKLMEAFGLPRPRRGQPAFTQAEADVLVELGRLDELWPADVRSQIGRAYGAMLGGIARAEVQAFQMRTEPRARGASDEHNAQLLALKSAFERLLPLADPLLVGVHRRWIEHELAQRAVSSAEERAGPVGLPGAVNVTFLFCDLKDFTAYAESSGDAAAIVAIERFFDVVARERGDRGTFVKSLGDGALLVYDDPPEAVAAGARIIAGMRDSGPPGVHAGAHRGVAIARSGDYFGGAVNLAARLLALGDRDELVATKEVVDACSGAFEWQPAGQQRLRGVASPVAVYRLTID